jgi:hypothetical protein
MALSQYVHLNIAVGTAAPTAQGFGTLLILSNGSAFPTSEVRTYRTFSQVAEDFDSHEFPYQAALAAFSQNPRPESIKVALLPTPSAPQNLRISLDNILSGSVITGSLVSPQGAVTTILADAGVNTAATALNLSNAIGAVTGISASASSNVVTTVADNDGEMWHFTCGLNGISIYDSSPDFDYDDHLDEVQNVDGAFYAIAIDNNSAKNIDKVARWAAGNRKLAFFSPQFTRPSEWGASLFTAGGDYTALLANENAVLLMTKDARTNAKEVAWSASQLVEDPGTITWAFKTLRGVGSDKWTATEENIITGDTVGGNVYKPETGIDITFPGKTAGGEWIDVVHTVAWLQARIEERIFGLFANSRKVPYTDAGVASIAAEVKAQLSQAERRLVIDSGWSVTTLPVSEQATSDRANRIVREITFTARLAGAVHEVFITGTITA